MTEHVLELSALAPVRQKARIRTDADPDGTLYELAEPDDFGAVDMQDLGNKMTEVEELLGSDKKLTKAQGKRLETLIDQIARSLIVDAPADVVAALPFTTKRGLAMRFFAKAGDGLMSALGDQGMALAPTGES